MRVPGSSCLTAKEISKAKHLLALGHSIRHIGRQLGRSAQTIARVLQKPEIVQEIAIEKAKLADIFERLTHQTLESITMNDIEKANFLQRVTGAAIMVDKTALLRGGPTEIVDVRVLMDVASLIRHDDDVPRRAPRTLTAAPEPEPDSIPISQPRPQTQPAKTQEPAPVTRVRYYTPKEVPVDSAQYNVLMHGLGKH